MNGEKEKLDAVITEMSRLIHISNQAGTPASPQEVQEVLHEMLKERGLPLFNSLPEVIERVRQIEADPGAAVTTVAAVGQGFGLGLTDEIADLLQHMPSVGGLSTGLEGTGISQGAEEQRRVVRAGRRERPWRTYGSEVLAGLFTPGLSSIGALKSAPTVGKGMLNAFKIGAAEGAVMGAAEGEGVIDRLRTGAFGAGAGAVLSPLFAAGLHGVVGLARKLTGKVGSTETRLAREAAQTALEKTSPRSAEDVIEAFRQGLEIKKSMLPADVPELRALGEAAARVSPEARGKAQQVLLPRAREATRRIQDDLLRGVTMDSPPSLLSRVADLEARLTMGSQAYEALARTVTEVDDEILREMLATPLLQKMFKRASKEAIEDGQPLRKIFSLNEAGELVADELPDFITLQHIKSALYDHVNTLYRGAKPRPGRGKRVKEIADAFYERTMEVVSGYGEAQANWAALRREQEALEEGLRFLSSKVTPEEVAQRLESLEGGALTSYREGAVHSVMQRLRGMTRERGDVSQVFNTETAEAKLQSLFPSEESFAAFLDDLDLEREFYKTSKPFVQGREAAVDIADLLNLGLGRREAQRYFEIPVVPELGTLRAVGGGVQRALQEVEQRKARQIGGLLGDVIYSPQADVSRVRDLLTGEAGRLGPPGFEAMMRTPRALYEALFGVVGDREKRP